MAPNDTSPWIEAAVLPRFPPLQGDARADVVVVGAGIAGLSAAYTLAGVGHDVLVLDQGQLGGSQAVRSTGHLCTAMDEGYAALERERGPEAARQVALSHCAAVQAIEDISRNERIECGFERVDGYLSRGADGDEGALAEECAAASHAGLDVTRVPAAPGAYAGFGPAVRFARQARISAPRYLAGLADAVQRRGVRLHGDTQVVRVEGGTDAGVTLGDGRRVRANAVVVAANVAFDPDLGLTVRQSACRTYVVALRIDAGDVPDALCWVGPPPGRYIRTAREGDAHWLVVGGEDGPDEGDGGQRFERLEAWARARFPMAGAVGHRWIGHLVHPRDSLAGIGRNPDLPDNVFISTGDSGNGLTHGMLTGLVLPELLEGRDSPFEALYAPARWRHGEARAGTD